MKTRLRIVIIIFLLCVLPAGLIIARDGEAPQKEENDVSQIEKLVEEKTPDSVKNFISKTILAIENFRETGSIYFSERRADLRKELYREEVVERDIDIEDKSSYQAPFEKAIEESKDSITKKPLKFLEYSFIVFAESVFKNQAVFYILGVLVIFFVVRALTKQ
jgi:hypothetical protein